MKRIPKRNKTQYSRNTSVKGDSIEVMIERLKEGEGLDGIEDRDLVYNDGETKEVNPVTNIRSDSRELMLEEKMHEVEYKHKKAQAAKEKPIKEEGDGEVVSD